MSFEKEKLQEKNHYRGQMEAHQAMNCKERRTEPLPHADAQQETSKAVIADRHYNWVFASKFCHFRLVTGVLYFVLKLKNNRNLPIDSKNQISVPMCPTSGVKTTIVLCSTKMQQVVIMKAQPR